MAFFLLLLLCIAPSGLGRRKHASQDLHSRVNNASIEELGRSIAFDTAALARDASTEDFGKPKVSILNELDTQKIDDSVQKLDPEEAMEAAFEGLAGIDFTEEILPQLQTVALSVFGTMMGTINPLLGFAFELFSGLLQDEEDKENEFLQKVMNLTSRMITKRLNQFYVNTLGSNTFASINSLIKQFANDLDSRHWSRIVHQFEITRVQMFTEPCWDASQDGKDADKNTKCRAWRKENGRGEALLLSMNWLRLAESVFPTLLLIGNAQAMERADDLKKTIGWAIPLLYGHFHDWSPVRMESSNFKEGSWDTGGVDYAVRQGQDCYIHQCSKSGDWDADPPGGGEYTGDHCIPSPLPHRRRRSPGVEVEYPKGSNITYQRWGRRRGPQDRMTSDLKKCRDGWIKEIQKQQDNTMKEVNAVLRAGTAIVKSNSNTWLQHSKYISGGSDGSCPKGYMRASTAECKSAASATLPDKQAGRWNKEHCGAQATPGEGCYHNGQHVWSTKAKCRGKKKGIQKGKRYHLALCVEDPYDFYAPCGKGNHSRVWETDCEKLAGEAMSGLKPRPAFLNTSLWTAPRGCSVKTHGDWQVVWNRKEGKNDGSYSVVCKK